MSEHEPDEKPPVNQSSEKTVLRRSVLKAIAGLGFGSAVFLHVASPELGPTEGCVAVESADLREILRYYRRGQHLLINP